MHQLPELIAQETHTTFSSLMWSVSLLLQCTLFVALFSRRVAPTAPLFTNYVAFFLLRSTLFFLILNPVDLSSYVRLLNASLLVEALLQLAVAAESTRHLILTHGGWTRHNITLPIIFLCAAVLCTYLTTKFAPPGDIRINPTLVLFSFYMVFLYGWTVALRESNVIFRNVIQGFAILGIINIVANIGRATASFNDHPHRYFAWSYVQAGAYVVIVIFWLSTLKPQSGKTTPAPLKTAI